MYIGLGEFATEYRTHRPFVQITLASANPQMQFIPGPHIEMMARKLEARRKAVVSPQVILLLEMPKVPAFQPFVLVLRRH
jgi:hypothetical protein